MEIALIVVGLLVWAGWTGFLWWRLMQVERRMHILSGIVTMAGPELNRRVVESPQSTKVVIPDRWIDMVPEWEEELGEHERVG